MDDRLSDSKVESDIPMQRNDPELVQAAIRRIQRHCMDQGFASEPASLRTMLAVAALMRLAEKKCDDQGAVFAGPVREDTARRFLKAAIEQFKTVQADRDAG
jgi:hypothetical protein